MNKSTWLESMSGAIRLENASASLPGYSAVKRLMERLDASFFHGISMVMAVVFTYASQHLKWRERSSKRPSLVPVFVQITHR